MSLKPKARWFRWLAPICFGGSLLALTVAACSVPQFEFPPAGAAGDSATPDDPCKNKRLDAASGETDFDCGGACAPCSAGKHCEGAADCEADLLCHEGTCVGGGCTNQAQDGTESDVDCGGELCKTCITGQTCAAATDCASGVCVEAQCQAPACNDQVKNGKETGPDCGGDCTPCPVDEPCVVGKDCISGECNANLCAPECPDGFANCDKRNDNACEINDRTDPENCGFCGNVCVLPNANAECSAGECRIKTDGCDADFLDCNGDPADGCEVDIKTNKLNCGACNKVCPALNGTPSCNAGVCEITCTDGFDDCDDSRDNGCEINLHNNSRNCGTCAKVCAAAVGYSPYCKDSACGQTMCPAGKGDCNGDQSDSCEINLTNDKDNCGDCGHACSANNANVACVNSQCVITSCKGKFADCDSASADGFKTGCETDTNVNTSHCGGCGKACTISNGTPKCDLGVCDVNSCNGTFRDCDGDAKTGCEVNVATNTMNCGGCGAMGSDCGSKYTNASSACVGSACAAPSCNAGFGDCVNGLTDGCETDTTKDTNNCGTCGTHCDPIHSSNTTKCTASACTSTCDAGWDKCKTPAQGCSTQLGTPQNCSKCGDACPTGGFCDPSGCVDHRDIVVVNKGTNAINGWSGGANVVAEIKLDHSLQTGKSNNRMLVVGIACTDNFTNPENVTVTYAGVPMLAAAKQEDAGKHSYAGIYYLLDSALPDNAGTNQVVASFGPVFTWGHGGLDVLELKNTMQVAPIASGGSPGDDCGGTSSRSGTVTFNQAGSLVYGVLGSRGATAATLGGATGLVETWNRLQSSPDKLVGAAAYVADNDNRTITWSVVNCFNSAISLVAIKRLNAN